MTAAGVCTLGDYTRHICILLVKYAFTSAHHCGACCSFTPQESLSWRQKTACRVRFTPASAASALAGPGEGSSVTFGLHSISTARKYYFRFAKSSPFVIYYTELSPAGLDSVRRLKCNSCRETQESAVGESTGTLWAAKASGGILAGCSVLGLKVTQPGKAQGSVCALDFTAEPGALLARQGTATTLPCTGKMQKAALSALFSIPLPPATPRCFASSWTSLQSLLTSEAFIPSKQGTVLHNMVTLTQISPISYQAWKHPMPFQPALHI